VVVDRVLLTKPSKPTESSSNACDILFGRKRKLQKLKHTDPRQKEFVRALLDMVCVDGLPISFVEGFAFRNLMEKISPEFKIPCRTKLMKSLNEELFAKVLKTFNEELRKLPKGSLHISLDIWSTCSRESVLGVRLHFINEQWEPITKTLAFKQLSGRHTGEAIKKTFLAILTEHEVSEDQIGYVMGDNASNISKAFNIEDMILDDWIINPPEDEVQGVRPSDPTTTDEEDEESDSSEDEVIEEPEDIIMARDFFPNDFEIEAVGIKRLRCLAHTIQLAINDALKTDAKVSDLILYLNDIIKTFRKSPLRSDDLSNRINRQLIPIGQTRWNSILFAAERLIEVIL